MDTHSAFSSLFTFSRSGNGGFSTKTTTAAADPATFTTLTNPTNLYTQTALHHLQPVILQIHFTAIAAL